MIRKEQAELLNSIEDSLWKDVQEYQTSNDFIAKKIKMLKDIQTIKKLWRTV